VRFDHCVVTFLWPGAMATEALADKNTVFRKLRAKSDNKVREDSIPVPFDFVGGFHTGRDVGPL
jgi:hypothetical protein